MVTFEGSLPDECLPNGPSALYTHFVATGPGTVVAELATSSTGFVPTAQLNIVRVKRFLCRKNKAEMAL